jgi:hypothetical protein
VVNPSRKVRLLRSVLIAGRICKEGEVHECPAPMAYELVGSGSAEYHEDHVDEVDAENKLGVQVHQPHHDDPEPRKISDPPPRPRVKTGGQ